MAKFKDKVALVTGGSRGIGRAIVQRFAAEGATVVTCGRGVPPANLPEGVLWVTADVSSKLDVIMLRERALAEHGRIDVLVNNAGLQIEKTLPDTSDDDWDLMMGVNVKGVFLCCREIIPLMRAAGSGVIVNLGSISGFHADSAMAVYNASKAFVHGLTRSIAVDHGSHGIRCNAVCPGWVSTEMADSAFEAAKDPQAARRDALRRHPLGRLGTPDDIASIVVWLASDETSFITGQTYIIDGGLVAASPLQPRLF
jgi:meso-butanediol dehydrogenase/(S,S)-butanediol dehydrogenase/diacetyl reductase